MTIYVNLREIARIDIKLRKIKYSSALYRGKNVLNKTGCFYFSNEIFLLGL